MPEPRKRFRVEQTVAERAEPPLQDADAASRHAAIMRELNALHAALTAAPSANSRRGGHTAAGGAEPEHAGHARPAARSEYATRIARELEAVLKGSEEAAQKILAAAEAIERIAGELSTAVPGETGQKLAHDISGGVVRIFEACNFQDLMSQRVVKVIAMLDHIEERIARAVDELAHDPAPSFLHGPRLPNDRGHVSQNDIDAMFAAADHPAG